MNNPAARWIHLTASAVLLLGAGCDLRHPTWRQYEEISSPPPAPSVDLAAGAPTPAAVRWSAPPAWTPTAASGMRLASFSVAHGSMTGQCTLIRMGGAAGGVEANVRRWIGQLAIPEPAPDALQSFIDSQSSFSTAGGLPCVLVDLTTLPGAATNTDSMLAAILPLGDMTVFAKLTGARPLLDAQRQTFTEFCRSFRRGDG